MLAFRPALVAADPQPLTPKLIDAICDEVTQSRHFWADATLPFERCQVNEEPFWELFAGHVLDYPKTRERRRFQSWWISAAAAPEPLLAVRWDRTAGEIHVTRAIECRVSEGYESSPGVIATREVRRWVRELVGTARVAELPTAGELRDELAGLLFQAVIGTSRLPLTSLESPLPAFALGKLSYTFVDAPASGDSLQRFADLPHNALSVLERAKALEALLRNSDLEIAEIAAAVVRINPATNYWLGVLTNVLNGASLSPYTDFVPRTLQLLRRLTDQELLARTNWLSRLVRLIDRHLAAYDLVKFHHRGANYPDALLLDEIWREFQHLLTKHSHLFAPSDFQSRLRRRALRHLLLLRLEYAGHLVPDQPTSTGENARVLPPPFESLPEEQIHVPTRRPRRIFVEPIPEKPEIWSTFVDLDDPDELRELGTALFLNRPFGLGKLPGEPDRTPLMSHLLFSPSVAERRLRVLRRFGDDIGGAAKVQSWLQSLNNVTRAGTPLRDGGPPARPGVVSLHDPFLTADDWTMWSTTRSSLKSLEALFEWGELRPTRWRVCCRPAMNSSLSTLPVDNSPDCGRTSAAVIVAEAGLNYRREVSLWRQVRAPSGTFSRRGGREKGNRPPTLASVPGSDSEDRAGQ